MMRIAFVAAVAAVAGAFTQISPATTLFGHAIKNGPLPANTEVCGRSTTPSLACAALLPLLGGTL